MNKLKEKEPLKQSIINLIILLLIAIFACIPLLSSKINIMYDDGTQHVARLIGTYNSIKEGQSFAVIMSNLCNNFGYSWNLFYSPFTAFFPLIFKFIGFSFVNSIKLYMLFITFVSGMTMYVLVNEVVKSKKIALIAAVIYMLAPYRLTDMYARNALAELTTFMFLPRVFQGLYGILKQKPKREYLFIYGTVFLLLTHTVIAMYTAIFAFIFLLTQIKKLKNKQVLKTLILSLVFVILITSFFYIPLLEHRLSADYEVFKAGRMERTDVLVELKVSFLELFMTPKDNIRIYEIGLLSVVALVLSPIVIKQLRQKYRKTDFYRFYIFSLVAGLVSVIMSLKIFPFEYLPSILKMLQFSFRMLEFSSFFFTIVAAINIGVLIKNLKYKDIMIIIIVQILLTCMFIPHLQFEENIKIKEERLIEGVTVTSKTGRVHAGCASFEYLPTKAFENRKYIEERPNEVLVLHGNATIKNQEKQNTNLTCTVTNVIEETNIELPYIYYLGYEACLEQNGETTKLKTYETDNGFVGVTIPILEEANLKVHYEGTMLMKITAVISILAVIILEVIVILDKRKPE